MGKRTDRPGRIHQLRAFWFDAAVCGVCPLRDRCVGSAKGNGRTVRVHPQEALLQQTRSLQGSEDFAEYRQRRVVVKHRLARLVQLGMRQARYFGRDKTLLQLLLTAKVANLTLVAGKVGRLGEGDIGHLLPTPCLPATSKPGWPSIHLVLRICRPSQLQPVEVG